MFLEEYIRDTDYHSSKKKKNLRDLKYCLLCGRLVGSLNFTASKIKFFDGKHLILTSELLELTLTRKSDHFVSRNKCYEDLGLPSLVRRALDVRLRKKVASSFDRNSFVSCFEEASL